MCKLLKNSGGFRNLNRKSAQKNKFYKMSSKVIIDILLIFDIMKAESLEWAQEEHHGEKKAAKNRRP